MLKRKLEIDNDFEKENRRPEAEVKKLINGKKSKEEPLNEVLQNDNQNLVVLNMDYLSPLESTNKRAKLASNGSLDQLMDLNDSQLLTNVSDQTTQVRSSVMSETLAVTPLDEKLQLMEACLKLVKSNSRVKYVDGVAEELPPLVGLNCRRTGSVFLPFGGQPAEKLIEAYSSEPLPEQPRVCTIKADADEISIRNPDWEELLKKLVQRLINKFECKLQMQANLQELIALKKGDRIGRVCKSKSSNAPTSFGTLFVELASNYTGGEILLFDEQETRVNSEVDFRKRERNNEYSIYMTAINNELSYEIGEVESGYRLILVYSLDWCLDLSSDKANSIDSIVAECLSFFSNEIFSFAVMLRDDYEGESLEKEGVNVLNGIDLDQYNILKRANDSIANQPFKFYIFRAELVVDLRDRKTCPIDPIHASSDTHDWEEMNRSNVITSWHDLSGKPVFDHLEASLSFFGAVFNPNSTAKRFWERPDRCDDAWGDIDENEHEVVDEEIFTKTLYYHRWFLGFWPRERELDMLLAHSYRPALDMVLKEAEEATNPEVTKNRLQRVLDSIREKKFVVDSKYISLIFKNLIEINDLDRTIGFLKFSMSPATVFDVEQLVRLLVHFQSIEALKDGLDSFLKAKSVFLTNNIKITEKLLDLGQKKLAVGFFNCFITPILESREEFDKVVINNRQISKIRVIGRDQPMDAKRLRAGDSEIIQMARLIARFGFEENDDDEIIMLKFTMAVQYALEPSSLKILIDDLANEWTVFKRSRRVRDLLIYRLKWIEEKMRKDSEFSWQMKNARFPENSQVEAFLHSDETRMVLIGIFTGINQARRFAMQHRGLKNGFSTIMAEGGAGRGAQVEIIKTKEYFESKRANLCKYDNEKAKIESLLSTF